MPAGHPAAGPDKILVGEIRDLETAEIAVQASLTGHLVFSTLHTNDAPSTITRLQGHGRADVFDHRHGRGDPGPAAGAARSARSAARKYTPPREMLRRPGADDRRRRAARSSTAARGCDVCNNTGYKGRVGLFELMIMNDDLRDMIMANAQTDELRDAGPQAGHGDAPRRGHARPASTASPRRTKSSAKRFWKRKKELLVVSRYVVSRMRHAILTADS